MSTTSVQERLAIKTPEFPHKEPSPLKRAVHTACAHDSVDRRSHRLRRTPSPGNPMRTAVKCDFTDHVSRLGEIPEPAQTMKRAA